ncbi:MAG: tRNA dihydrouridine synthase DusB [Acidobacteria bacterium]|nr:tRNA dihydrouridine synthase DusB [Acidobacteriota bacterium]
MASIRNLAVDPPLILAPMAGITDSPFRRIVRSLGGCGLVSMEFVSSEAITRGVEAEHAKLPFHEEERPISIQVYGSEPWRMAEAARVAQDMGADVVDVNMGCPANKILKGCAGAALMGDLGRARLIVAAIRAAVTAPLTVKFRSGLRATELNYLELGRIAQEEGADAVTLHPRTARQQYSGRADWRQIAELVEALSIPVIGNGDVQAPGDALRMFAETGCAMVMIGRAVLRNPWIFRQAADLLKTGRYEEPPLDERFAVIRRHFRILASELEGHELLHKLKVFTGKYTHGLPGGRKLRGRLTAINDPHQLLREVEQFLDERLAGTGG